MNLLKNNGWKCLWRGHPAQPTDQLKPPVSFSCSQTARQQLQTLNNDIQQTAVAMNKGPFWDSLKQRVMLVHGSPPQQNQVCPRATPCSPGQGPGDRITLMRVRRLLHWGGEHRTRRTRSAEM